METSPETTYLSNGESIAAYAAANGIPIPPGLGGAAGASAIPSVISSKAASLAQDAAASTGTPVQTAITQMILAAQNYACGRQPNPCTTWNFAAVPTDPINEPAQTGLTYLFGGRTPDVRTLPKDNCPQLTYGVDCSGFIYNVAAAAGLSVPIDSTSATQSNPKTWTVPPGLFLEVVTDGSIQTGDILAWPHHIGIANSSSAVISSTGVNGECAKNIVPPRGPRTLSISSLGLGSPTTVLRLSALQISPSAPTVAIGSTVTLSVTDTSGNPVAVTWQTSDSTLATVSPVAPATASSGVVTGVTAGSPTITVTDPISGATASVVLTVTGSGANPWMYQPAFENVGCSDTETISTTVVDGSGKTVFTNTKSYTNDGSAPGSSPCGPGSLGTPDYLLTPPVPVPLQSGATYTVTTTWSASGPGQTNTAIYGLGTIYSPANGVLANLGGYVGLGLPAQTESVVVSVP